MTKIFTVQHGHTYRAQLKLSFFEDMADNDVVADKFRELGFIQVTVSGSGEERWAQGVWNGPDESVPLTDEHIEYVEEVKAPKAALEAAERAPSGSVGEQGGLSPIPAIDPFPYPSGEVPEYGPDTGIVPPYLKKLGGRTPMSEKEKEEWDKLHEDGG